MMKANRRSCFVRTRVSGIGALLVWLPVVALGQAASPFMTGATALQTNILAWLTPIAIILVMALGGMAMANRFAREVAERYKVAVDLAVHDPRPDGDSRNFHAHLLTTTREVTPTGLGAKAGLDMAGRERRRRELPDHRQEYLTLRERWATLTNEALREANVEARIDHRSLAAQGIDREPLPKIPLMHLKMEQRGVRSELAEGLRAGYRERVQRRLERSAHAANVPVSAPAATNAVAAASTQRDATPLAQSNDLEEIRRQAREAWLRLRPKEAERAREQRQENIQGRDDDVAL
jgi:hypothetical protein